MYYYFIRNERDILCLFSFCWSYFSALYMQHNGNLYLLIIFIILNLLGTVNEFNLILSFIHSIFLSFFWFSLFYLLITMMYIHGKKCWPWQVAVAMIFYLSTRRDTSEVVFQGLNLTRLAVYVYYDTFLIFVMSSLSFLCEREVFYLQLKINGSGQGINL